MKLKLIVCILSILLLTQACMPTPGIASPAPSSLPVASTGSVSSPPVIETTLPQVVMTPMVSTAVAASTLTHPIEVTRTSPAGNGLPPEEGITLQDSGQTFILHVGDSFLLNLGTDVYNWTVNVDNEKVLHLKVGVMVIKGAQGIYEALAPGTATLTATGNPLCQQSRPPCAIPSILFSVTIVVE